MDLSRIVHTWEQAGASASARNTATASSMDSSRLCGLVESKSYETMSGDCLDRWPVVRRWEQANAPEHACDVVANSTTNRSMGSGLDSIVTGSGTTNGTGGNVGSITISSTT